MKQDCVIRCVLAPLMKYWNLVVINTKFDWKGSKNRFKYSLVLSIWMQSWKLKLWFVAVWLKMTEPSKVIHVRNVGHEISEVYARLISISFSFYFSECGNVILFNCISCLGAVIILAWCMLCGTVMWYAQSNIFKLLELVNIMQVKKECLLTKGV